jgi:POT family proton-dependent oligopeptide transporter
MNREAAVTTARGTAPDRHPRGLYVLFATEMWERFSFYTMLALFTLYLQDKAQGFGWTAAQATTLRANYLGAVFFSPIVGGWLADRFLGYRRAIMIGGVFFIAGHVLLAFPSIEVVYAALVCLVIGNGLFKPNVSTIVGNLYPKGSHLRDRGYNIFYMGINLGATLGPIVVEFVHAKYGFHPAFAVAAGGMLVSVLTLVVFRRDIEPGDRLPGKTEDIADAGPPMAIDAVPERRRILALIVVYLVSVVFWMLFFQNGSTLTYFANDNTAWNFSGIISNAIEPFFVIAFSLPLVLLWKTLDRRGKEPATTTKIVMGMFLMALAYFVMFFAGKAGGDTGKVSPWWLVGCYALMGLAEITLSPMALSLVSKVAPARARGLMMGLWFVATGIGGKLTQIGVYWTEWRSTFFAVLATLSLATALLLVAVLKPLKRAMPGV